MRAAFINGTLFPLRRKLYLYEASPISRVAFITFRVPRAKDDEFRVSTRSISSASIIRSDTLNSCLVPRSVHIRSSRCM